jgi:hypothetical protein
VASGKLLVGDKTTLLLIPAIEIDSVPAMVGATLVDYAAPTVALLNRYIPIVSNSITNFGAGGNVTCAIQDDYTLGTTDPEVDDTRNVCSKGASGEIKRYNFEAEFNFFRDLSLTDNTSEFNMARDLTRAPDIPYFIAERIGYDHMAEAEVGQEWSFYYVHTDNPVPGYDDDGWQMVTQSFVPKGVLNANYEVTA